MSDAMYLELYDSVALGEIELTARLMISAGTSEHHLSKEAIDIALGVIPTTEPDHCGI